MIKFKAYTYDLLGNEEEGWEVNDVYSQGEISMPVQCLESDAILLEVLRQEGYRLSTQAEVSGENDYTVYIEDPACKPVLELRRVK